MTANKIYCCLSSCSSDLTSSDERVEVCSSLSGKKDFTFKVKWNSAGDAIFHHECWQKLHKASRSRSVKNDPFKLSYIEKDMIKKAAKTAERFHSFDTMKTEACRIANMIKQSSFCCVFTGAGISTSAGIGDYRGKNGKWTEMDRSTELQTNGETSDDEPSTKRSKLMDKDCESEGSAELEDEGVAYEALRPTYTHEAIKLLLDMGFIKHIISQNGDGLHGLSGVDPSQLSELHGNVFIEKCENCGYRYHRSYYVMDDDCSQYYEDLQDNGVSDIKKPGHGKKCDLCGLSHRTGRRCCQVNKKGKKCNGFLVDTIINFRDHLEEDILKTAETSAENCDLMLSLGTTMTVTPASDLVLMGKTPNRLVICNRQKTELDGECSKRHPETGEVLGSRVFGDCDVLMKLVLQHLVPRSRLTQWETERDERMKKYDEQREIA